MSSSDSHAIAVAKAEVARRGYSIPSTWEVNVGPIHTAPEPGPTKQIVWFCSGRTSGSCVYGVVIDPATGLVDEFIDKRHPPPAPKLPPRSAQAVEAALSAHHRLTVRPFD
ncbi:MAG TPA: hypothetical protein VF511_11335, partial [Chthoniobacterales bacterium]